MPPGGSKVRRRGGRRLAQCATRDTKKHFDIRVVQQQQPHANIPAMRNESHRIFLQSFAPRSASGPSAATGALASSPPGRGGRTVVTTSAAVRLTDAAKAFEVTNLLRGKFGLPATPPGSGNAAAGGAAGSFDRMDRIRSRLNEFRGSSPSSPAPEQESLPVTPLVAGEQDALVLVATITSLPKGYVAFEHEFGSSAAAAAAASTSAATGLGHDESLTNSSRDKDILGAHAEGPPSPEIRMHLGDRSRSVSSAVTVKASNQQLRQHASSISSAEDVHSTTKESDGSKRDPNRDPMDMSSSQGYQIVKVDPYKVRPGPPTSSDSGPSAAASTVTNIPKSTSHIDKEIDDLEASLREGMRTTGATNGGWAASLPKQNPAGIVVSEDNNAGFPPLSRRAVPSELVHIPPTASPFRQIHISSPPRSDRIEYEVSPEPCNIVRTLRPNESPLSVRDDVVRSLVGRMRQAERDLGLTPRHDSQLPTPQVRWFFQPSLSAGSKTKNVSGCIELDGYCSEVDDDFDDIDGEDSSGQGRSDLSEPQKQQDEPEGDRAKVERWWSKGPAELRNAKRYRRRGPGTTGPSNASLSDERHRLAMLSRYMASLNDNNSMCGYLLKRSNRDYNVWKSVHCVLTEDCLFWVTRMKTTASGMVPVEEEGGSYHHIGGQSTSYLATPPRSSAASKSVHFGPSHSLPHTQRIGRHHMIKLSSTLLVESDPQSSNPLSNVPNAFEIVCPSGLNHIFRVPPPSMTGLSSAPATVADPRATCSRWVSAIGERIVRCFDNSGMEHSELIGSDESAARWGRTTSLAVDPLLNLMKTRGGARSIVANPATLFNQKGWVGAEATSSSAAISQIIRLGVDVSEFRELILHSQHAILSQGRQDDVILGRIRHIAQSSSWDDAERLLFKSSCIMSLIESSRRDDDAVLEDILSEEEDEEKTLGENVERLKRDVFSAHRRVALFLEEQKVLRERAARGDVSGGGEEAFLLPSIDLFDELLDKLQRLAAITESKIRMQEEKQQQGQGCHHSSLNGLGTLPPIVAGGPGADTCTDIS